MSRIYEIADRYVERWAALDPIAATQQGIPGHDRDMTNYSPAGFEARAALDRETLAQLADAPVENERDRVAREVMQDILGRTLQRQAAGEHLRALRILASPAQGIRDCFDLMARDTADDWDAIAARLDGVPNALAGYQETLLSGLRAGLPAARRQAAAVADQAAVWSGAQATTPGFFALLLADYDERGIDSLPLRQRLAAGAEQAAGAYAAFRRFLLDEYAPAAEPCDPVGRERYGLLAQSFLGLDLDLDETYAWGWDELHRIEAEMAATAEQIRPGARLAEVKGLLDTDPARSLDSVEALQRWLQDLQDRTMAALDGTHFDIPGPVKRIEVMIAPPGGALAQYYTGPTEDFSRPGRVWVPVGGRTRFPLWDEVSTAYHEGVPGHHLQIGIVTYLAEQLSRYQRTLAWLSGHGEGWALYAERLMAELGFFESPDYHLGMLRSQAMRAARVVVDIGLHCELPIPAREAFHAGETWTPDLALPFLIERGHMPAEFAASELDRYLGWPGQAISYKVGERMWLDVREAARQRRGSAFNLKEFHQTALDLGPLGLAQLRREMERAFGA